MRVTSSALSLAIHAGLVLTVVWGTARGDPPTIRLRLPIQLPPVPGRSGPEQPPMPRVPNVPDADVQLPDLPAVVLEGAAHPPSGPLIPVRPQPGGLDGATAPSVTETEALDIRLVDDPPVLLAGRIPAYPELLRQAGVEGRVVLEAVVDTLGRVEAGSITVVAATHLAFVASARQALAGALFRPARVGGRAVRVRVRFPAQFMLRNSR
jgi:protein TonB